MTKTGCPTETTAHQLRAYLHLVRLVTLYIMAEPESTDPDLATDMEGIFKGAFMNQAAEQGNGH